MDFVEICSECGGKCCRDANPPISRRRLEILLKNGVKVDKIAFEKYMHPKTKEDGFCIFLDNGKCSIHEIKPETCVAGPFTFDLKGDVLEIFLKKEDICPLVTYLKRDKRAYKEQFKRAVASIVQLILDLDKESLEEILKIEEVETVKVAEIKLSYE
ncbi:MAG: YkgJ family cysteine cluster protein [Archaeoglobaceae archaeon]|nr:YkgJ family cysteine cluster protein [Archaeoglobaceae archaeon]MDW7989459.1 YkgJ family cysteine cluster protein [Archaeoglobaceae archaeon]